MENTINKNFNKLTDIVLQLRADLEKERKERLVSELQMLILMQKVSQNGKDISESILKTAENEVKKLKKEQSFLSNLLK